MGAKKGSQPPVNSVSSDTEDSKPDESKPDDSKPDDMKVDDVSKLEGELKPDSVNSDDLKTVDDNSALMEESTKEDVNVEVEVIPHDNETEEIFSKESGEETDKCSVVIEPDNRSNIDVVHECDIVESNNLYAVVTETDNKCDDDVQTDNQYVDGEADNKSDKESVVLEADNLYVVDAETDNKCDMETDMDCVIVEEENDLMMTPDGVVEMIPVGGAPVVEDEQ